jgi:hypothetical protein
LLGSPIKRSTVQACLFNGARAKRRRFVQPFRGYYGPLRTAPDRPC